VIPASGRRPLEPILEEALPALPEPQRKALEVALLRSPSSVGRADQPGARESGELASSEGSPDGRVASLFLAAGTYRRLDLVS
jgi:hypothetical protein